MRHLVSTRFALAAMLATFTFGILACAAVDMVTSLRQPAYWHPVRVPVEVGMCGPLFAKQS